ncbi:hypothetical protein, partial [Kistimonas scapharcae]|uniref:hypothetical protein n=1 Tax=Kistimonas scapharcae TaxID=1036133 RepID=UPI0031EA64E2
YESMSGSNILRIFRLGSRLSMKRQQPLEADDDKCSKVITTKPKDDTEYLPDNPLAPIIASGCSMLLDAILEAGLKNLVHLKIHGSAPLLYACLYSNAETVDILIKHGAKLEQTSCLPKEKGSHEMSALHAALRFKSAYKIT